MAKVGLPPLQLNFAAETSVDDEQYDKQYDSAFEPSLLTRVSIETLSSKEYVVYKKICCILDENRNILKQSRSDVPTRLLDHLYLGDSSTAMNLQLLDHLQVTAVVNCASAHVLTSSSFYRTDWQYLSFAAEDCCFYNIFQHFPSFAQFMDECYASNSKTLVHCVAGINRSAVLSVAYVMRFLNLNVVDAVRFCVAKRPGILENTQFVLQLVRFASQCNAL